MDTKYTCSDYRQEMILLGLRKQLHDEQLTNEEQQKILALIEQLEEKMGMKWPAVPSRGTWKTGTL